MLKRCSFVLVVSLMITLITGCSSDKEEPSKIAEQFAIELVNTMNTGSQSSAKRLYSLTDKKEPTQFEISNFIQDLMYIKEMYNNDVVYKVIKVSEVKINKEKNNAKVSLIIKGVISKEMEMNNTMCVYLYKRNGKWVVYNYEESW